MNNKNLTTGPITLATDISMDTSTAITASLNIASFKNTVIQTIWRVGAGNTAAAGTFTLQGSLDGGTTYTAITSGANTLAPVFTAAATQGSFFWTIDGPFHLIRISYARTTGNGYFNSYYSAVVDD